MLVVISCSINSAHFIQRRASVLHPLGNNRAGFGAAEFDLILIMW